MLSYYVQGVGEVYLIFLLKLKCFSCIVSMPGAAEMSRGAKEYVCSQFHKTK